MTQKDCKVTEDEDVLGTSEVHEPRRNYLQPQGKVYKSERSVDFDITEVNVIYRLPKV